MQWKNLQINFWTQANEYLLEKNLHLSKLYNKIHLLTNLKTLFKTGQII